MKILVTGGTGFIGSCLAESLVKDNHEVFVTGSKSEIEVEGTHYLDCHINGINYSRIGDIDLCFHQAANNDTISKDKKEMFQANLIAPKELFQKLFEKHKCSKIIYASSASVYGNGPTPFKEENPPNPLSFYAESKLAFDEWVLQNNYPALGLRYTNVYGYNEEHKKRRSSMIFKIIKKALKKEIIELFKYGEQKRNWVYVKDIVKINKLCIDSNYKGILNCGSNDTISFIEIIKIIENLIKEKLKINFIDYNVPFDFQNNTCVSLEKIKKILNYTPDYSVVRGIEDICLNMKKNI